MSNSYNKKDIKNTSSDFRTVANRLLNSEYDTMDNNLKRFVNFIEGSQIIKTYLNPLIEKYSNFNIQDDISKINHNGGLREFIDNEEEVAYTYQVLLYITENNVSYRVYVMEYSTSRQFNDMIKSFNDKFILPFVNSIDRYFERICVEMGMDETTNYYINNGGQLNIANGNSNINAVQNNYSEIDKLVDNVRNKIDTIADKGIQEEIIDNVEGIQEELKKENIKKGRIRSFSNTLGEIIKRVPQAVELTAAITEIISFTSTII